MQKEPAYCSCGLLRKLLRSADLTRNHDVPHTPVLVVDGRYLTSPSMKGNAKPDGSADYEKFIASLDQLIALARNQHRAAKK